MDVARDGHRQRRPPAGGPRPADLALLALGLVVAFALLYPLDGARFPVGPDAPVYLWWARAASVDGLSVVGYRAGGPALSLVLEGSLPLTLEQAIAALGPALAAATGLAGAAVAAAAGGGRVAILLAGVLSGTYTAHLAGGYTANLVVVPLVLGAVALLATTRRGPIGGPLAAGALLAAAGVSHAPFLAFGSAMLVAVALTDLAAHLRGGRDPSTRFLDNDTGRVAVAVGGGVALTAAGLAALTIGPAPPLADTSKDAFVRRAGRLADLAWEYRARFARLWVRYVPPVAIPLAAWGAWTLPRNDDDPGARFVRRVLLWWLAATVVGAAVAWPTGWAPPIRVLGFGYAIPVGAALGIVAIHRAMAGRWRRGSAVVAALLAAAMVAGPAWAWSRQRSQIHDEELEPLWLAASAAAQLPEGTSLLLAVENDDPHIGFLATLAGNVFRAAMPPERVRDVRLLVNAPGDLIRGEPTIRGNGLHDEMSRRYLADLFADGGGQGVAFVLEPFNARYGEAVGRDFIRCGPGVTVLAPDEADPLPRQACPVRDSIEPVLQPFAPWSILLAGPLVFLTLLLAGYGWSRAAIGRSGTSLALAPAFGLAALVLAGFVLDRVGVRLDGTLPTSVALLLPSAGGYLVALRVERHAVA